MPHRRNGTYGMEHYLSKLLVHRANAFRVWMGPSLVNNNISYPACPGDVTITTTTIITTITTLITTVPPGTFSGPSFCTSPLILETRPRRYSLENAWRMDWVLRFSQRHGMYAHVVLDSWPQEIRNGEWNFSVFNAANGGPLALPFAMYDSTDSDVTDQWVQRLAYVGARFGAFRSVLGWELINEPDTPYMFAPQSIKTKYPELKNFPIAKFIPWIRHLARLMKTGDQGQHLVTTNFAGGSRMQNLTYLPEIDFLGSHDYQYHGGATKALHTGGVASMQKRLRYAITFLRRALLLWVLP